MKELAYVIDCGFVLRLQNLKGRSALTLGTTRLIAKPDRATGTGVIRFENWEPHIRTMISEDQVARVLVLAHMRSVESDVAPLDRRESHVRVPRLERRLADALAAQALEKIWVFGFHHTGAASHYLETAELSGQFFRRLVDILDEEQSVISNLERYKHDLLKPFTPIRLEVALAKDDPARSEMLLRRFIQAAVAARKIAESPVIPEVARLSVIRKLFAEDRISAAAKDQETLEDWFNGLNTAIDDLRRERR